MKPKVSVIMGSTSDLPVMEGAAKILNEFKIPFEINALSAHRTPDQAMDFARKAYDRGIRVIIAGAGGAAHLPGVLAALTPVPVIGVPVKASISIDGWDSILSILQMPPGIPVATVGLDGARNAGILAAQILATSDEEILKTIRNFKEGLAKKIVKANEELAEVKYEYKVN
ncbi:MAG TPA: 5-(carboxyamino)imidazole ribonucleotide mutase [Bacteroidales bacterium]|nr:5-(carboxyamino)imidazole ribonucleotide mutase [Bacteroidales bacterium]